MIAQIEHTGFEVAGRPAKARARRSWIIFPIGLAIVALMAAGSLSSTVIGDPSYALAQPGL